MTEPNTGRTAILDYLRTLNGRAVPHGIIAQSLHMDPHDTRRILTELFKDDLVRLAPDGWSVTPTT